VRTPAATIPQIENQPPAQQPPERAPNPDRTDRV
jgi:hypothetical protein